MSGEKSLNGFTEMKKIARKPRIPRIHARYMTRSVRVVVVIIGDSIVIFEKFSTIFCLQFFSRSIIFWKSQIFIIAVFCNKYFGFEKVFLRIYFWKNILNTNFCNNYFWKSICNFSSKFLSENFSACTLQSSFMESKSVFSLLRIIAISDSEEFFSNKNPVFSSIIVSR